MKLNLKHLYIFLVCLTFSFFSQAQLMDYSTGKSYQCNDIHFNDHLLRIPSNFFKIKKTSLGLNIKPQSRFISGSVGYQLVIQNSLTAPITLDFSDSLVFDSITSSCNIDSVKQENNEIKIYTPVLTNDLYFTVYYHGFVGTSQGFGSFATTLHDSIPVLWTLSQPYGARDWWPNFQGLGLKSDTVSISVTCPTLSTNGDTNWVSSNGLLQSRRILGNGTSVFNWETHYPTAPYLVAVAVTNYRFFVDTLMLQSGPLRNETYCYPNDSDFIRRRLDNLVDFFNLYESHFGKYPYSLEKHGHTQWNWGGGMEHQTNSFVANMDFGLISHELGHQWFGDLITCGSWSDIWLNEGFASFLTGLCYEHLEQGYWYPIWKKGEMGRVCLLDSGSVYVYDTSLVSRIFNSRLTYSKGSMVLHQLRWEMGDSAFFNGVKKYINDATLRFQFAFTSDLIRNLEDVAGYSLQEYFQDWIYGEGLPVYHFQYEQKGSLLTIVVQQKPTHASVSFFEQKVPVRIYSLNQKDSFDFVLPVKHQGQAFSVMVPFDIDSIVTDPDYRIIQRTNSWTEVSSSVPEIFPNPFSDFLTIHWAAPASTLGTIRIYNVLGQELKTLEWESWMPNRTIDMSTFASGVYSIDVTFGDFHWNRKVVKN